MLPKLKVAGRYVQNAIGQQVQLTGVHWPDLVDKPKFYYGPGDGALNNWKVDLAIRTAVAKTLGANHIRYSIHLEKFINPYIYTGTREFDNYANVMDEAVQQLINQDLYGYFVLHYGSSQADPFMRALLDNSPYTFIARDYTGAEVGRYESSAVRADWLVWCEQLAAHYADIPNVLGYQIWAEPAWAGYERTASNYENYLFPAWWQFNLETARAIHRGNPYALVVVMSPGYYWVNYMSPNQWDGRILPEPNIIYGVQKYESEDWRGGSLQKAYDQAYQDWFNGVGTLEDARAKQEQWYLNYLLNFAVNNDVPVMNNEMAYPYDLVYNYKDGRAWPYCSEQAQGFYDIWKKYLQGWTQHRWATRKNGNWGFFENMDVTEVGDYVLTPSAELMSLNFKGGHKLTVKSIPEGIDFSIVEA